MGVFFVDPLILRVGVSFPFDQILQASSSAEMPRIENLLYFEFFGAIHQVWWWALVIRTMCHGLVIRCEKIDVKHGVNAPRCGQIKAIVDMRHHLIDPKRTVSSGHKLCHRLIRLEMTSF